MLSSPPWGASAVNIGLDKPGHSGKIWVLVGLKNISPGWDCWAVMSGCSCNSLKGLRHGPNRWAWSQGIGSWSKGTALLEQCSLGWAHLSDKAPQPQQASQHKAIRLAVSLFTQLPPDFPKFACRICRTSFTSAPQLLVPGFGYFFLSLLPKVDGFGH